MHKHVCAWRSRSQGLLRQQINLQGGHRKAWEMCSQMKWKSKLSNGPDSAPASMAVSLVSSHTPLLDHCPQHSSISPSYSAVAPFSWERAVYTHCLVSYHHPLSPSNHCKWASGTTTSWKVLLTCDYPVAKAGYHFFGRAWSPLITCSP